MATKDLSESMAENEVLSWQNIIWPPPSKLYPGVQRTQSTKNIKKFITVRNRAQRPWLVGLEYKSSMTNIAYL